MSKNTIKRVLKYLKKDVITLIITFILSVITVLFTILVPILIGDGIDLIIEKNNVDFNNLKLILFKVLLCVCITAILQWIMMVLSSAMTYRITRRLRNECFSKLQVLPLNYLDQTPYGETVNKIISDVDSFADGLLLGFTQIFTGLATIFGTLIIMFILNYAIAIVVVIITPLSLFVAKFIASKTYSLFKAQSVIKAEQTGFIDEMVTNLKVVKAYNHEDENLKKFEEINLRLEKCSLKAIFFSSLTNPCTRFVNSIVYALVALVGALFAITQKTGPLVITVGTLNCFLSYANQYTKPFNEISSVITELQNALACANRVFELLDIKEEIKDDENAINLCKTNVSGNIKLDNVCFSYIPNQKLIQNFNLDVVKGKKVAIVGPTGCGKTTLINLLMRFYDVTSGKITVDEHNIKNVTRKSLRESYGMVLQDTWIRHGTVRDNISIGKPDASLDEIINACKKTSAHNFIKRLPNGYDTIIKDDGNLSVGEKQLLCISRVMLILPPMLILDEATSSIDTRTEIKIQEAFNTLMNGKTSFIVAHRLSTIQEADIILVMNNGNVIEQGSHEELLRLKGFYYKLYNSQFAKV